MESNRVILTAENFAFAHKTTMFYDFMKSREINILRWRKTTFIYELLIFIAVPAEKYGHRKGNKIHETL